MPQGVGYGQSEDDRLYANFLASQQEIQSGLAAQDALGQQGQQGLDQGGGLDPRLFYQFQNQQQPQTFEQFQPQGTPTRGQVGGMFDQAATDFRGGLSDANEQQPFKRGLLDKLLLGGGSLAGLLGILGVGGKRASGALSGLGGAALGAGLQRPVNYRAGQAQERQKGIQNAQLRYQSDLAGANAAQQQLQGVRSDYQDKLDQFNQGIDQSQVSQFALPRAAGGGGGSRTPSIPRPPGENELQTLYGQRFTRDEQLPLLEEGLGVVQDRFPESAPGFQDLMARVASERPGDINTKDVTGPQGGYEAIGLGLQPQFGEDNRLLSEDAEGFIPGRGLFGQTEEPYFGEDKFTPDPDLSRISQQLGANQADSANVVNQQISGLNNAYLDAIGGGQSGPYLDLLRNLRVPTDTSLSERQNQTDPKGITGPKPYNANDGTREEYQRYVDNWWRAQQ